MVFVSGQGPFDPATGEVVGETIEEQTRQCLRNVEAILKAAGSTMDDVVQATFILLDESDFAGMNEEWNRWFPTNPPARQGAKLPISPKGMRISIAAIAVSNNGLIARAVHAQEHQAGSGGHRPSVRRRAGPGVPRGDQGARARELRPELPARPARLSLSVRPHAHEARGGVRGRARERADESRRRDRRARRMGCGARPARHAGEATRPGQRASRSSSSARPTSARIRAKTSMASATGGLTSGVARTSDRLGGSASRLDIEAVTSSGPACSYVT